MGCTASAPPQAKTFGDNYELGKQLGTGAFSVVHLATNKKPVNGGKKTKFAVKLVSRANLSLSEEEGLLCEVGIMRTLSHPNVVACLDFYDDDPENFFIVMEICSGGELYDKIVEKSFYSEKEARDVIRTVVGALKYVHSCGVVHRDLKPENLLLANKFDDRSIKIADFGLAATVKREFLGIPDNPEITPETGTSSAAEESLKTQCGSPCYIAPEVVMNKPYGKAVDMWAIGVILYTLLGGYLPFEDGNQRKLFKKIKDANYKFHPQYWDNVSPDAKNLIQGLLTIDENKRLTADQVLDHAWLNTPDNTLTSRNLEINFQEFKRFHALRKFKAAAYAVVATNRFKTSIQKGKVTKRPATATNRSNNYF